MHKNQGTYWIAGVDEAGRGPLAGPVIAAAIILDPQNPISGLADSKTLTAKQREALFQLIQERAISWAFGSADVFEIDNINILQATFLAMQRAVAGLKQAPDLALIDGNRSPILPCQTKAIIRGDQIEPAISGASIIAKVIRDHEMLKLDQLYPHYGFAQHKGYGTREHLKNLEKYGPCEVHRRSFEPVRRAARTQDKELVKSID